MRRFASTFILSVCLASSAFAQSKESAPLVIELPASTGALALGNTFHLGQGHPDAVFYNPALVEQATGIAFGVQRYGTSSTMGTFSVATDWLGGGVGLGVQVLSYGAPSETPLDLADALFQAGPVGASDLAATLAYAREIKGFLVGMGIKVMEQRIGEHHDATVAADFGVAKALRIFTVGLSLQHMGAALQTTDDGRPLPFRVTLASSLDRRPLGPLDVAAAGSVARWQDGRIVPSGGLEVSYWPVSGRTFIGRVGLRRVPRGHASPVTLGAAFVADSFTIEYAFEGFEGRGNGHRIGLRWR